MKCRQADRAGRARICDRRSRLQPQQIARNGPPADRRAAAAKCDAVKFQLFDTNELYSPDHANYQLFKSIELPADWLEPLKSHAEAGGLEFFRLGVRPPVGGSRGGSRGPGVQNRFFRDDQARSSRLHRRKGKTSVCVDRHVRSGRRHGSGRLLRA